MSLDAIFVLLQYNENLQDISNGNANTKLFLSGKNLPNNILQSSCSQSSCEFYLTSVFSPFCWIEIGFGWRAQGNE